MPTTDYSSSRLTNLKRSVALASFRRNVISGVNAGTSVRSEQPSGQLGEILTYRHLVGANTNPPVSGADCGCTVPVFTNPGGC